MPSYLSAHPNSGARWRSRRSGWPEDVGLAEFIVHAGLCNQVAPTRLSPMLAEAIGEEVEGEAIAAAFEAARAPSAELQPWLQLV